MVQLYGDRLPELYEIVGTHYERAESWPDAARYLTLAAEKSMTAYAVPEAAAFADRALDALRRTSDTPDPVALVHVYQLRGAANELLNRWDTTCESYAALANVAAEMGDGALEGEALIGLASALLYAHRSDEAVEVTARARATADAAVRASALIVETFVHTVEGRMDHVHGMADELEAEVALADDVMRGVGLGGLCEIHHWMGDEQRALTFNERAMEIALENEASQAGLWNLWDRGLVLTSLGRYEEALGWLDRHAELCRRVGDIGFWTARSFNTSGWAYQQINAWDRGRQANEAGLEAAHRMNDPEIVRNAVLNLSDIAMVEGDPAKALNLLREVESSCAADATRGAEWMKWRYIQHLWASLAAAHLAVGDPAAALEYADRCLADAARTRSMRYLVRGREERARALAAQGAGDDSIADATEASHLADQIGSPTLRWRSRLTLGDVLGTADRQEDAAAAHAAGHVQVCSTRRRPCASARAPEPDRYTPLVRKRNDRGRSHHHGQGRPEGAVHRRLRRRGRGQGGLRGPEGAREGGRRLHRRGRAREPRR
jgi:tetratricopeptide (TPR) repeat protein